MKPRAVRLRRALRPHLVPAMRAFAVGSPVLVAGLIAIDALRARLPNGGAGLPFPVLYPVLAAAALSFAAAAVGRRDGQWGEGVRRLLEAGYHAAVLLAMLAHLDQWNRGLMRPGDCAVGSILLLAAGPIALLMRASRGRQ